MTNQEYLAHVPLFEGLRRGDLERIGRLAIQRSFKKGETIIAEGESGIALYVIISGKVRVVKQIGGRERVLRTLGPNEYFGEMALLDEFRRSASVVAEEDTECLLLVRWDFRAELHLHPEIALHILPLLSRRLREAEERAGL